MGYEERSGLPISSQNVAFPDIMPSCDLSYAPVLPTILAVVLAQSNFETVRQPTVDQSHTKKPPIQ